MEWLMMLTGSYFFLLFLALVIARGVLISPSVVLTMSFCGMLSLALYFKDTLGFGIEYETFEAVFLGGVLFVISELIIRVSMLKNSISNTHIKKTISISNNKMNYCIVFLICSTIVAIYVMYLNTAGGDIATRMYMYKNMMVDIEYASTLKYRFIVSQMYKICLAITYICCYVSVQNSIIKNNISNKVYIIIVMFGLFSVFSNGARQPIIEAIVFSGLVYLSLADYKKIYNSFASNFVRISLVCLFIIFAFYYSMELVGRRASERSVMEYLTVYLCGGLYAFNLHVFEPSRTIYWGQSSFADIYALFGRIGLIDNSAIMSYHEFDLYGNTLTIYGRWYEDFGLIGVCVMAIIVSMSFSYLFYNRLRPLLVSEGHITRIIYNKLVIALVWAGYDDRIRPLISTANVITLLLLYGVYKWLVKEEIVE